MVFKPGHHIGRPKLPLRPIKIVDGVCHIPLNRGMFAFVDEKDRAIVEGVRWYAKKSHNTWYAYKSVYSDYKSRSVFLHKLVVPEYKRVDHIDGNGLNNQRGNLRDSSHAQNMANRDKRADTSSKFKGVSRTPKGDGWRARLNVNRKSLYLGRFNTEEEAARVYDKAAQEYFGEFARLNFPKEAHSG